MKVEELHVICGGGCPVCRTLIGRFRPRVGIGRLVLVDARGRP
jgi:hydrogenase maturation factor